MSEVTLPKLDFDWAIWTIPKHKIKKPKDITPQSEIRSKAICLTKSASLSHEVILSPTHRERKSNLQTSAMMIANDRIAALW